MAAQNPVTGEWQFFVDKCLPFGSSISCAHFQRFSNALKHIIQYRTSSNLTNYLDDFLFITLTLARCNFLLQQFFAICKEINFPVSEDKTEWAAELTVFLGILLNGRSITLGVPEEKRVRAVQMLLNLLDRCKATVKDLQIMCGYLNFICKAIFPGRAFVRRMYAKFAPLMSGPEAKLKQYHHIKLDPEFKDDCKVWLEFLNQNSTLHKVVNRPMVDLSTVVSADQISFYSDASAAPGLGFGCVFDRRWIFAQWEHGFIERFKPSIAFLELFALCAGIFTWHDCNKLQNCRVIVYCDNQATVEMINNITSSCPKCMILIWMLVLNGLKFNRRGFAKYLHTKSNVLADSLSRQKIKNFKQVVPHMHEYPDKISPELWPASKFFI